MAYIGMRSPIAAKVATRVDGSAVTYETPLIIGPAVSANITFDVADNPDYGDDVIVDNDKGINGYNITLETNDISKEARAVCLGWKPITNSATPPVVTHYEVVGGEVPEIDICYHTSGEYTPEKKVVWICHALTANSDAEEWWPDLVGPGCAINTDKYFVCCVNMLGSCYGSSGPSSINPRTRKPYMLSFPPVTVRVLLPLPGSATLLCLRFPFLLQR